MATITGSQPTQPLRHPLRAAGGNEAIGWLSQILTSSVGTLSGEDAQAILNNKLDESILFAVGASTPVPSATTPWIFYRTDNNAFYLKNRTGSPGSYTYSLIGPFQRGDYQLRLIYHTADDPPAVGVSWNAGTNNFNITSGNWSLSDTNAKWMRIVALPATSDTPSISPEIRLGAIPAEHISYTRPSAGNLSSSVNNVKEALDEYNSATLGGGGGSLTQVPADWNAESGVSRILNKPVVAQTERFNSPSGSLQNSNDVVEQNFTIDSALTGYRTQYDSTLYIEAYVNIFTQQASPNDGTINFSFEITDASNNPLTPRVRKTQDVNFSSSSSTNNKITIKDNLPNTFSGGKLRLTLVSNSGTPISSVTNFILKISPDLSASNVIVNQNDLGNNIAIEELDTVEDVISQVDELPIQPADYEDVDWPGSPNGIDDNGVEVRRTIAIHRNLQNVMRRQNRTFYVKISYKSAFTGSPTDGRTDVDFSHAVYTDANSDARISLETFQDQTATATDRNLEVNLPSTATRIFVGFTVPTGQADARLLITDYDLDIVERVSANLVTVDAAGFNGNLATTDDTAQKVAQKFDDFTSSGGSGGSTYGQRTTLNNINRAANTIETVDLVSEQITLSSRLIDEGGERLNNPIAITVGYTITLPPALTGNVGTLFIRSVNNSENAGDTYGQQEISGITSGNTININAILPHSASIPNTFYIILQIAVQPQAYAISLTNGIMYAERDLIAAIPSENITIPEDSMASPFDFLGGLREVTGVSGIPNTPANVEQLATKADYLLRQAYNPYQKTENLDRFIIDRVVDTFDVGSTSALSSAVTIPSELRELETPLVIRVRARVGPNPIGSNFTGTASLRNEANSANIGTPSGDFALSGSTLAVGDYINFERVLSVAEVAANTTFRIRFIRTVNNGATAQFSDASVYMEVSAGSTGGMALAEPEVVWRSGATISDRTTAVSTTTNYSLIGNRRFDQYRGINIWFDSDGAAGSGLFSYVPVVAVTDMINSHGTAGRAGLIILEAFSAYKLIKPVSQTAFRIYEGSSNVGIRRIYGIP